MAAGFYDVGRLVATLGLNTAPFMASAKGATDSLRSLNIAMMATGRAMTRFVTLPMILAGGAAVGMQRNFEKSMSKIVGLVGVASSTVDEWGNKILEMSPKLSRPPEELADALFFIASAGIRGSEALDILEMSAQAAASGLGDTKVVADLVTSAMNAWGKENLSATQATDVLVAAVREGKAEADSLAGAMGKVLPIASSFGVEFHEIAAAFAAMTRTGTNADIAATQLKAILSQMASPSEQASKAMAKFGTSAENFRRIMDEEGLINALLHLREAVNASSSEFSKVFPNIRALMGVLDLLGANLESNIQIFDALSDATGSTKKAFEEYQKTTDYKLNEAVATLKKSFIELGQVMKSPVLDIVQEVTGAVQRMSEWFGNLSEMQQKAVLKSVAFTAAMGPVLVVVSRLSMIVRANPWMALVTAIGLATTALSGFIAMRRSASTIARDSAKGEEQFKQAIMEEQVELANLFTTLKTAKQGTEQWDTARDTINSKYGAYLQNLIDEKTKLEDIEIAQKRVMAIMFNKAMAQNYTKLAADQAGAFSEGFSQSFRSFADVLQERSAVLFQRTGLGFSDFISSLRTSIEADIADMGGTLERGMLNSSQRAAQVYETFIKSIKAPTRGFEFKDFQKAYFMLAEQISAASQEHKYLNFMAQEYAKVYKELTGEDLFGTVEESTTKTNEALKVTGSVMGIIPQIQEKIKLKQEEIAAAGEKDLPRLNDELLALQRKLKYLQQLSGERGELAQLELDIARAREETTRMSGDELRNALEQIRVKEQEKALIEAQVGGFGEMEALQMQIAEYEILRANAGSLLVGHYNEQLRILKGQLEVLRGRGMFEDVRPRSDSIKEWKKYYDEKMALAKADYDNGVITLKQYQQLEADGIEKLRTLRANAASDWLQTTSDALSAISTLIEMQKQKELSAVGDNAERREEIERAYHNKQKMWAISQAIINGALAITNMIANVPGSVINPATWVGIGVATAATAAQIGLISAQSFAKGGVVYGETLASVGDYPGVANNPEVIAPLSSLKALIQPMPNGRMPKEIELKVKNGGRDLYALIKMEDQLRNTY